MYCTYMFGQVKWFGQQNDLFPSFTKQKSISEYFQVSQPIHPIQPILCLNVQMDQLAE